MKIRHQTTILLGAAVVFQLAVAAVLLRNISDLGEAGRKETKAKAVISACQDMKGVISRLLLHVAITEYMDSEEDSLKVSIKDAIAKKFSVIDSLVADDPESSKIASRYFKDMDHLAEVASDLGTINAREAFANHAQGRQFARYLDIGEQMEEALIYSRKCIEDDEQLMARYVPVVKEWSPRALKQRENLNNVVFAVIGAEAIFLLIISLWFGRRLMRRLSILMDNIDRFQKGEKSLNPLQGGDELSELDKRFRQMALAKQEAELFKTTLMSMVAHDLRSPLTSSGILINIILSGTEPLTDGVKSRLTGLQSELSRLVRLANSLLDVEKLESNKFELSLRPTYAIDIICSSFAALEGAAGSRNVSLVSKVETEQEINVDEDRIVQVLVNLISNAVKFCPPESTVTVRAAHNSSDGCIAFEVYDQGSAVPEDQVGKLFQKFSQLESDAALKSQGSGFGLYLTDMIAKAHGGRAGYKRIGQENCFYFEIACTPAESHQS